MFSLETERRTRPVNHLRRCGFSEDQLPEEEFFTYTEECVRRISVVRFLLGV